MSGDDMFHNQEVWSRKMPHTMSSFLRRDFADVFAQNVVPISMYFCLPINEFLCRVSDLFQTQLGSAHQFHQSLRRHGLRSLDLQKEQSSQSSDRRADQE